MKHTVDLRVVRAAVKLGKGLPIRYIFRGINESNPERIQTLSESNLNVLVTFLMFGKHTELSTS